MRTPEERLALLDEMLSGAAGRGLLHRTPDDEPLDGRTLSLDGRRLVSFGSCSYLGLEVDPRLRRAACAAALRYGTQFSASRGYMQVPLYLELEELLNEMFGGFALTAPSTTLAHLSALPVLIESTDAVILDQGVHHSVQTATRVVQTNGTAVEMIRHNRVDHLERVLRRLRQRHRHVWYLMDGVYSMFADFAPYAELSELLERYEQLHIYADDAHGIGWCGEHGRGPTLTRLGVHERVVVAGSLNKAFAAAGGVLVFGTAELRRRVRTCGGPMIFSGPIQPPMLGAAIASARIHLSDELVQLQAALRERIELATARLLDAGLPLISRAPAPIRYVMMGLPQVGERAVQALLDEGFYTNLAIFPAVPIKQTGVRLTLTVRHRPEDIVALSEALARHVPRLLAEAEARPAGAGPTRAKHTLQLEYHRSIADLDAHEWDRLLASRGTFSARGLALLERVFCAERKRPEDRWRWHYYVVRDETGAPVLATFFTAALWKDDMLVPAAVSRRVEERRREDPYYLTSMTFSMGSLLTEGDHLYLDRSRDWRGAVKLLMSAVTRHAAAANCGTLVLRDLDGSDAELGEAVCAQGFVKLALPPSLVIDPVPLSDTEWLAGLSQRARAHQRREVLPFDGTLELELLRADGRRPSGDELDRLHELYRNVHDRGLELNTFELPRALWPAMLEEPCWELVLMRLRGRPDPVAFGAHFIGRHHYAPLVIGLDYDYVRSHHVYRQALRQALLRARALGAQRLMLGIGATLEKQRFGARAQERCAFAQAADHYSSEVLATVAAT